MPQDSALYGVARVRGHEKGLIGRDKLMRLIEGSAEDAVRQLVDINYGGMPDATVNDVERMIENELFSARELVREVTMDEELTNLFLYKADVHNLKLLLKLRLTGNTDAPSLMRGGVFDGAEIKRMVDNAEYKALPELLRDAMYSLETAFLSAKPDPVRISVSLDTAYINMGLLSKSEFAQKYFRAMSDFDNVLAVLRLRANGGDAEKLKEYLLPEGEISYSRLYESMDAPIEGLSRLLAVGEVHEGVARGLREIEQRKPVSCMERERDNHLMRLASAGKYETDTIAPIIGYLLAREQEAKCVRLVVTAKRNALSDNVITERLRELYGC